MEKKVFCYTILFVFSILMAIVTLVQGKETSKPKQILITNVNIFDGKNEKLKMDHDLLVEDNFIKKIGKGLKVDNALVIDGGGRTLIPGLTDAHVHLMLNGVPSKAAAWFHNCPRCWRPCGGIETGY
jgi:adenine deaminase